jgi:hypothetical protein
VNVAKIEVDEWAYNYLRNELVACERALRVILELSGQQAATFGNVYVYRAEDGGVGAYFVDENGERLQDLNYAMIDRKKLR